jgi:ribonuclease P protein component
MPAEFLKKHGDYQRVYREGRKGSAPLMGWFVAGRAVQDPLVQINAGMRIGLTVPKVLGKAVDRNRIKRRMRAALRQQPAELLTPALDLVLHPRRTVLTVEFPRLVSDLEKLLREATSPAASTPSNKRPAKVTDK